MNISSDPKATQALAFFEGKGWTKEQAAGIVGNLYHESQGLNTAARNKGDGADGSDSIGLAQWNGDRAKGLEAFATSRGKTPDDFETQLEYVQEELNTTEGAAAERLRTATTVDQAVAAFLGFERPSGYSDANPQGSDAYAQRLAFAQGAAGVASDAPSTADGSLTLADLSHAFPVPADTLREIEADQEAAAPGWGTSAWEAVTMDNTLSWMLRGNDQYRPDPDYVLAPERLRELGRDIPTDYLGAFEDATSDAQAEDIRRAILDEMKRQEDVDSLGWSGIGLRVLGALADPVGIAAGLATGGLGPLATKAGTLGRLGRAIYGAVSGAAVESGLAAYQVAQNPIGEESQILWAGLGGLAFGAGLGALSRNPATAVEMGRIERVAQEGQGAIEASLGGRASLSAAAAPDAGINPLREDTRAWLAIPDAEAPRTWASGIRWDVSAQGKSSDIALTRALAERLVEDPVGNADRSAVAAEHASRTMDLLRSRMGTTLARSWRPAFKDWLKEQGIPWRKRWSAMVDFDRQVGDFVRDTDITRIPGYSPHVKAAGEALRKMMDDYAELGFNPGALDGRVLQSLPGFERRLSNPYYLPRIFDHANINRLLASFGEPAVRSVVRQAIRDAQPEIAEEVADRIASGYFKRIRTLGAGMEVDLSQRWSGENLDLLREELAQIDGLAPEEIEGVLKLIQKEPQGGTPRGKPRLLLNEAASVLVPDPYTGALKEVRFTDLLVKDASILAEAYNRHMAGQIALARIQIRDVNGDLLVDGIRTRGDFTKLLDRVKAVGNHMGLGAGKVQDDTNVLQWMYRRVAGIPDEAQTAKSAEYLRLLRDFNYIRVMNQAGFAQVAEIGNIIGQLGFRAALQSMPSLRILRRQLINGEARLVDELGADLEAMTGNATDYLRGLANERWDVDAPPLSAAAERPWVRTAGNLLDRGKEITSNISGMRLVDTVTRRWAAKAIAHKFAALAQGTGDPAKLGGKANMNRLRSLGLSEEMLGRVLGQLKEHGSWTQGNLGKLRRINPDAWTDQQALASFEMAVANWSKRVIQDNDPGALAMWMSHPIAQIITQFRSFMLGAWTKTLLHNIHMGDAATLASFSGTMVFGGLAYMVQTYLQATGRSDREEWLNDRLSMEKISLAAFQRAGFSTLFPMIADTGASLAGHDPLFDFRTIGQASSVFFGNPTGDLLNNAMKGISGATGAALREDEEFSQAEARSLMRLMPWGNFLPLANVYNAMIGGLEK